MIQPDELKTNKRLKWSTGTGTDVWQLFCACISGDLPAVRQLVAKDPSLIRCQHAYRTPIYFAVRENQIPVVSFLLDHGANPIDLEVHDSVLEICRDRGYVELEALLTDRLAKNRMASSEGEAIAAAIREFDLDKVKRMLDESPQLLTAIDLRSNQPIHWATMTRQLELIDELLARGADVNAPRADGGRPIQLASGDYHYRGWRDVPDDWPTTPADVIAHLRSRGADCDICTASYLGDRARVEELLRLDPSSANRVAEYVTYYLGSGSPLKNAAAEGHIDIVRLLLDHGADPNLPEEGIAPDGHALYAAAANGHHEIARLLLEHGANPDPEVESSADALSRAISNSDEKMIELLCSYGASRGVHLLAYDGDIKTAAAMFKANPSLANDTDALANAAGNGHEAFVRLMLKYQPDLPRRTSFPGWLPCAATHELNDLLFEHGYSPSQRDWLMITPLHRLAGNGDVDNAAFFIDRGADLHARDEDLCSTPMGWAAKFGRLEMVKLLLERGAMSRHPDDPAWATPLAWATRNGHSGIAELLKAHGAT